MVSSSGGLEGEVVGFLPWLSELWPLQGPVDDAVEGRNSGSRFSPFFPGSLYFGSRNPGH
jgi:hypothetical protein